MEVQTPSSTGITGRNSESVGSEETTSRPERCCSQRSESLTSPPSPAATV